MSNIAINFQRQLDQVSEHWSPKIIAQLNDYHFKLTKIKGDFIWHRHSETDEAFIVLYGEMCIELRDSVVKLKSGEMYVVKRGVEHKPSAQNECCILLVEPIGTISTGDVIEQD